MARKLTALSNQRHPEMWTVPFDTHLLMKPMKPYLRGHVFLEASSKEAAAAKCAEMIAADAGYETRYVEVDPLGILPWWKTTEEDRKRIGTIRYWKAYSPRASASSAGLAAATAAKDDHMRPPMEQEPNDER